MKLPMALVNAIKKKLQEGQQQPVPQQVVIKPSTDAEMIDTSSKPQPVLKLVEESKQNETIDIGLGILIELKENDLAGNEPQHRDTVQTLYKIVANLISKPLDPQVRRFNKGNKAI